MYVFGENKNDWRGGKLLAKGQSLAATARRRCNCRESATRRNGEAANLWLGRGRPSQMPREAEGGLATYFSMRTKMAMYGSMTYEAVAASADSFWVTGSKAVAFLPRVFRVQRWASDVGLRTVMKMPRGFL